MSRTTIIILILIVATIALIVYINIEPSPDSKRGQSRMAQIEARARADSIAAIEKHKADSIRKIAEEKRKAEEAYRNRPWKLSRFVDEFGEPAGKFIKYETIGQFSNSAASNEILYVKVYVTKSDVGIMLYEYSLDRSPEKPLGSWTIRMKNDAGQLLTCFTDDEWNQTGGADIGDRTYVSKIISLFKRSKGNVKVVIDDKYSSRWTFEVDVTGFTKEFGLL